jgi:hypothetical protein
MVAADHCSVDELLRSDRHDVSKIGAGSSWEIEQIGKRQFLDRCIFIVQKGYEDDARKSLTELRSPAAPPLYVYNGQGLFEEPAPFDMALTTLLKRSFVRQGLQL